MAKVTADSFADAIKDALDKFQAQIDRAMPEALKETANETRKILRSTSPKGKSGKYARGWQYELKTSRVGGGSLTIYNARPGLTHLLENGHAVRNGTGRTFGSVPGEEHIAPANEQAQQEVLDTLIKVIEGG